MTKFPEYSHPFEAPRAVLLDMDGTLVDHFEALYRCYKFVAEKLDQKAPSQDEVRRGVGGSMPVTIRKFFPENVISEAIHLWRAHFDEIHLENVILLDGAMALLQTLHRNNIKTAVFTNKIGQHSRNICDDQGLSPYLAETLGAEDTEYRKPQPEFSRHILEKLGTSSSETIMIGDSPFDIEAAHCVGMTAFCVPTGSHSVEELESAGADYIFSSLREINDGLFAPLANSAAKS